MEIFSYNQFTVVFKVFNDVILYAIGYQDENEILLSQVLQTLIEAFNYLTKDQICKKSLLENFESLIICIDEIIDEGIIVTLDSNTILARALMKDCE